MVENLYPFYKTIKGKLYWNEKNRNCVITGGYTPDYGAGLLNRPSPTFVGAVEKKKRAAKEERKYIRNKKITETAGRHTL